ncbi:hypothetical protein BVC80_787g11 [Macleaya cordata]|uniref:Uncharacterized protein n=1 Tax=Macleaya cordata TaxID=56857 RepID=A0A200Q8C4_MACCD|nr:hypothetical protein BVC80_787g11 [Macleaya cordata]
MSSILMSSQGMAFATAMAVSGTVILLAFCRPKSTFSATQFSISDMNSKSDPQNLRSCIYSEEKKREKKMKKKVHFAEDVVDPVGNSEEFRREHKRSVRLNQDCRSQKHEVRGIPANRMALYNGILRDREHHGL